MTYVNEESRYRSGYAAGQRDAVDSNDEDESQKRSLTGDDWADIGYAHGFDDGKETLRDRARSDVRRLLAKALWIPQISGGLRRVGGIVRGTS